MSKSASRVGRPALNSRLAAREALLDAAVGLFAEQGVAATTTAAIAARARVTPALVHYYFRSRASLLDAVVDERLSQFVTRVLGALPAPGESAATPSELVETIVDAVFDAVKAMPWMPPIWIREIASGGGLLRERMLRHLPTRLIEVLSSQLGAARRSGLIAPGVEPRFAFLTIAGVTMFPLATQPLWGTLGGGARLSTAALRRHARAVLSSGLTGAPPRASRRSR